MHGCDCGTVDILQLTMFCTTATVATSECALKALVAYVDRKLVTWISREVTLAMIMRLCDWSVGWWYMYLV
jgi:hypothetical protein